MDHLKALPDGKLVVPNGWSPEHGPVEDGVSYNQEIVWDLFNNYVAAADALGVDKDYRDKIAAHARQAGHAGHRQLGPVARMDDRIARPEISGTRHAQRPSPPHVAPVRGVSRRRRSASIKTPELAAAAKVSLDARGIAPDSDVREWSFAWRTALYARLHDGEAAHRDVAAVVFRAQHLPQSFRPASADAD